MPGLNGLVCQDSPAQHLITRTQMPVSKVEEAVSRVAMQERLLKRKCAVRSQRFDYEMH